MLTCAVAVLALFASVQGRAVNISNTWVLPEEGFPVFYRYFRDRISWYEADAVCQFHHANLVTVDTTAQYDAVRAYLKELDISSAVWVGLIRSNPDGDFTWTDYRGLSSDGYWSSAPDARAAPLCAAADPVADYRWEARACGGPTVASFICELPVPQWALGNEGCMVRALPALTVLYLPESAAVQLTADCGLAGVRRVQCTGNVKREDLLKDLSCEEEEESSTSGTVTAVENTYSTTTDTINNVTDQDTTSEVTTENIVTEQQDITSKSTGVSSTQAPYHYPVVQDNTQWKQQTILNKLNSIYSNKHINFDLLHNNNLQSNDIPKIATDENELTLEQSEKIEDEKHLHHKMLHDELARHGNFETIFTQPTDHFVPPLVMAKAKVSDDMTVLSLAEKHAQQLAERSFGKHYLMNEHNDQLHMNNNHKNGPRLTTEEPNKVEIIDKPLVMTFQSLQTKDGIKKDKFKSSLPKKYQEKYDDPKGKHLKVDNKLIKFEKSTEGTSTQTESTTKIIQTPTSLVTQDIKLEEDSSIDLTVVLKEPIVEPERKLNYSGDVANIKTIQNSSPEPETTSTEKITSESPILTTTDNIHDVAMTHEIIKITIVSNEATSNPTHTVFELTTRMPDNKVPANNENTFLTTQQFIEDTTTVNVKTTENTMNKTNDAEVTINPDIDSKSTTPNHFTKVAVKIDSEDISNDQKETITPEKNLTTKYINPIISTTQTEKSTIIGIELHSTTIQTPEITTKDQTHDSSTTESYEENGEFNSTDISSETIDDFQSPLLSAANEPLHRPNRSRRPQPPPNRLNKFNPFRILG